MAVSIDAVFALLSNSGDIRRTEDNVETINSQDILESFLIFKAEYKGNSDLFNKVLRILQYTNLSEEEKQDYYISFVEFFSDAEQNVSKKNDPSVKGASSGTINAENVAIRVSKEIDDYYRYIQNEKGDVSQIGFYKILENDYNSAVPSIIPSSVSIQEHLLNQPVPTVRSKSSGLIPDHRSKHIVSIDILYPNYESFSNSSMDYPSFRNLLNMFRFMPINSIYSPILSTCFVSQYTFPRVVDLIKENISEDFFNDSVIQPRESIADAKVNHLFNEIIPDMSALSPSEQIATIKELFDNEDPSLDVGFSALADNILSQREVDEGNKPLETDYGKLKDFISTKSAFPVPVGFKSASIQTHTDMPGAVIARFSFGIISSPAFPYGNVMYRTKSGAPSFDPSDCYFGKKYISVASSKMANQVEEDLYVMTRNSVDAELNNSISLNDIKLYYFDYEDGLISFSTANPRYGETPSVILEKISGAFNTKSATIPLMGSKYPTVQYMGVNSNAFQLIFAITNKQVIADFMELKARIVNSERNHSLSRSFGVIKNDFINSLGISRVSPQSISIDSDPDNPDLYHLTLSLSENYEDVGKKETLQLEKGVISTKTMKKVFEYFYDLYRIWYARWYDPEKIGFLGQDYEEKLDKLMSALGITAYSNKYSGLQTLLDPGLKDHECIYGPLIMGIIKTYVENKGGRFTQNLSIDFPELASPPPELLNQMDTIGTVDTTRFRQQPQYVIYMLAVGYMYSKRTVVGDDLEDGIFVQDKYRARDEILLKTLGISAYNARTTPDGGKTQEDISSTFRALTYNRLPIDITSTELDFTGGERLFENPVAMFHNLGVPIPRDIWNNTFEAIISREYTKGLDVLVSYEQMDAAFTIFRELIDLYPNSWKFDIVEENNNKYTQLFYDYGLETEASNTNDRQRLDDLAAKVNSIANIMGAKGRQEDVTLRETTAADLGYEPFQRLIAKLNLTEQENVAKDIQQANNVIVNLYPDLYMPTYGDLLDGEVDANNEPIDPDAFLDVFGPKYGDSGTIPTFKSFKDLHTPLKQISARTSVTLGHFIDPDIFYHRERDKNNFHNAHKDAKESHKEEKELLSTGKTIRLPVNWSAIHEKALEELNLRDQNVKYDDERVLNYISSIFQDGLSNISDRDAGDGANLTAFVNLGINSIDGMQIVDIKNALKGLAVSEDDYDIKKHRTYKRKYHIEFISNEGKVIANVVKDEKLGYRVLPADTTGGSAIYYNNVDNLSFALEEDYLNELSERSIMHTPDLTDSVLKSFPAIRVYFIEEDRDKSYNTDDFYGYGEVIECNISSHIYDNDICRLKLANFSGILSTMQFTDFEYNISIKEPSDKVGKPATVKDLAVVDEERERFLRKIMLRPGVHIMVKMGYGNNIDTLKTVFTGEIAEIKPGAIVELVAQGYQTELHNEFGGFMEESWWENFAALGETNLDETLKFNFLHIVNFILLSNDSHAKRLAKNGMIHLGKPFSARPKYQGLFGAKDPFWGQPGSYGGGTKISNILGQGYNSYQEFTAFGRGDEFSWFDRNIERWFFGFAGTDLSRNIYVSTSNNTDINVTNEWLITNAPVIDSLREVTRYMPNYIATVVPYEQDATLFIGDPAGIYQYRSPTLMEDRTELKFNGSLDARRSQSHRRFSNTDLNYVITEINNLDKEYRERIDKVNYFTSTSHKRYYDDKNPAFEPNQFPKAALEPVETVLTSVNYIQRDSMSDEMAAKLFCNYLGIEYVHENIGSYLSALDYLLSANPKVVNLYGNPQTSYAAHHGYDAEDALNVQPSKKVMVDYRDVNREPILASPFTLKTFSFSQGSFSQTDTKFTKRDLQLIGYGFLSRLKDLQISKKQNYPIVFNNTALDGVIKTISGAKGKETYEKRNIKQLYTLSDEILENVLKKNPALTEFLRLPDHLANYVSNGLWGLVANEVEKQDTTSDLQTHSQQLGENLLEEIALLSGFDTSTARHAYFIDFAIMVFEIRYLFYLASKVKQLKPASIAANQLDRYNKVDIINTIPWNYKPFRDSHILSSEHDLIANNLTASESDMWSAVALRVPMDTVDLTNGSFNWQGFSWAIEEDGVNATAGTYRIDSDQSFGIFPNKTSGGVNFKGYYPGPKDILENFTEINATTPSLAQNALKFRLAQGLSKMYRGNIICLGKNIKPYDQIQIVDNVNNMYGKVMVERVIQNFTAGSGWTTTIVPCGLTTVNSKQASHAISDIDKILYSIGQGKTARYLMNAATILSFGTAGLGVRGTAQLFLRLPFGAPLSGAGTLGKRFTYAAAQNNLGMIGNIMKGMFTKGGSTMGGLWEAAKYPVRLSKDILAKNADKGIIWGAKFGNHLKFGSKAMMGTYFTRGAIDVTHQFLNAGMTQTVALVDKSGESAVVHQPCKVSIVSYNGGPFIAGLEDPYETMINIDGWGNLMADLEYAWREWWATPGGIKTDTRRNLGQIGLNRDG